MPEEAMSRYLDQLGKDPVLHRVREGFREIERRGIPTRYLEYFAACVLSHFDAGTVDHRLPVWLASRLDRVRCLEAPLTPGTWRLEFYYRVRYEEDPRAIAPGPQPQELPIVNAFDECESRRWELAGLPCGFEIVWPYEVPLVSPFRDLQEAARELWAQEGLVLWWIEFRRFVAFYRNRWIMLPARRAELSESITVQQLYRLPDNVPIGFFSVPLPMLVDGTGVIYRIRIDDPSDEFYPGPKTEERFFRFRSLGEIRPFQPQLIADPTLAREERDMVCRWQRVIQFLCAHPALRGGRGRPRSRSTPPGNVPYSKVVEALYREKLFQWVRQNRSERRPYATPTEHEKRSLWESAKREGRRIVPKEARDRLPDGLKEYVERQLQEGTHQKGDGDRGSPASVV